MEKARERKCACCQSQKLPARLLHSSPFKN
jgi:hypothetical protein